jgi:acetoacetate decarboxylase
VRVSHPPAPWELDAQLWLSVFVVRSATAGRPRGVYGVAFVDYQDTGVLAYHELLVARLLWDRGVPRVRITDIWVDSEESRDGGRALWAIPKQLANLPLSTGARTACAAVVDGVTVARGSFSAGARALPRTPYAVTCSQPPLDAAGGPPVVTPLRGSTRLAPCRGSWELSGPLGFLSGRRPVLSVRLRDTRLTFGRA